MRWTHTSVLSLAMGAAVIQGASCASEKEAPKGERSRHFEFSYTAKIDEVPAGAKSVDLWIPVPQSSKHQSIGSVTFNGKIKPDVNTEPDSGNRMAHWKLDAAQAKGFSVTMTFDCKRHEVSAKGFENARELTDKEKKELAEYLAPNKLVLVGGPIVQLAEAAIGRAQGPAAISKAAYDYTVSTMKYDKPKDKLGWGKGSTQWACDNKFGNCTDFHAMIMSLGRTKGVPVKFEMGFSIPEQPWDKPGWREAGVFQNSAGAVAGYHCWAKMYLGGVGWVPVDASEAQKNPKMIPYYYGNLTPDRVQMTTGRDVNLIPKQAGEPLNFFIYPYGEADGKPFTVNKEFSFKEI